LRRYFVPRFFRFTEPDAFAFSQPREYIGAEDGERIDYCH
jgi:hypothetical protein